LDEPRLILRFRNYVKGIVGTEEHTKILHECGSVYWGWWKRKDEPNQNTLLANLMLPCLAILISPAEEVQFLAEIRNIHYGPPPDLRRVPEYYREESAQIPVWFELTRIEHSSYEANLGDRIARFSNTLFDADSIPQRSAGQFSVVSDSIHLLHLSDIHLGEDHNFLVSDQVPFTSAEPAISSKRLTLVDALRRDLDRIQIDAPAAVIVSGDVVSRSNWNNKIVIRFFEELAAALKVNYKAVFIVPGNHDFYRQNETPEQLLAINEEHEASFRNLRAHLYGCSPLDELNYTAQVFLERRNLELNVGLLSSARWTSVPGFFEYGFVGKEKYRAVLNDMAASSGRPSLRILVLHHHLLPIQPMEQPGESPKKSVSITLDAAEILKDAQESRVSLILHGHQHRPDVIKTARYRSENQNSGGLDEDMFVCAAGSAGSKILAPHQWNTYSLFSFAQDGRVRCVIRKLDPEDSQHGDVLNVDMPLHVIGPNS
jgi:predicted MPP superfamily phosphohydrolase